MGNKLSPQQKEQIKEAFNHFDVDKSGEITVDEFQKVLRLKKIDAMKLLSEYDRNNDGSITFDEFLHLVAKKFGPALESEGKDGISLEKMKRICAKANIDLEAAEIEQCFNAMDVNKDHVLSVDEFIIGFFATMVSRK